MTTSSSQPSVNNSTRQSATKAAVKRALGIEKKNTIKPMKTAEPKLPCRVTVTTPGWHGAKEAAIAAGCSSISDLIEKVGRGQLSVIPSDAIGVDSIEIEHSDMPTAATVNAVPQHVVHYHAAPPAVTANSDTIDLVAPKPSLGKLIATGLCAAVIIGSLLYIADKVITVTSSVLTNSATITNADTPATGDIIAGYTVSDEYGIRPFHPVTGAPNVPHNGVDLAMPVGTPIYAVGDAADRVEVECWWDADGGGWVVNQTAESYPGHVFQSLHMSENGCREGLAMAGEVIAYSGNSGLGTGEHYDFRVKIDGEYVPPATKYLESAVTGDPPKN
ncbi:MAG: M23 family metallopeptidase [Cyanobacteria bacterium J06560_5]